MLAAVLLVDFQDAKRDPRLLDTGVVTHSGLTPANMAVVARKQCTESSSSSSSSLQPAGRRFAEKEPRIQLPINTRTGDDEDDDDEDDDDGTGPDDDDEADDDDGTGPVQGPRPKPRLPGGAADPATNRPAQQDLSTSSELGGGEEESDAADEEEEEEDDDEEDEEEEEEEEEEAAADEAAPTNDAAAAEPEAETPRDDPPASATGKSQGALKQKAKKESDVRFRSRGKNQGEDERRGSGVDGVVAGGEGSGSRRRPGVGAADWTRSTRRRQRARVAVERRRD